MPHIFAALAIAPLISTLKMDLISGFGLLAFGTLFVSSVVYSKRAQLAGAPNSKKEDRAQGFVSDFEDRGLGWFWEIGREGELTYISKSISVTLGKTQSELLGLKFASILSESRVYDKSQQWMSLGFHLSSRTSFSDLPFQSSIDENRYWSISGSPVYDQLGNYKGFRGNGLDLSQREESDRALTQLARCDPLTGLANRMEINRTLKKSLVGPQAMPSECSLFLLDLDKFKPINDTMGHLAGDRLLKMAGHIIVDTIGEKGQVGRVGGDEFQIVLPGITDQVELEQLASQVIDNLGRPQLVEGNSVIIGASVGVSTFDGLTDSIDATTLIRDADLALYAAKKSGGGVCRFYEPAMLQQASAEREFEEDLRQALVKGQLSLEYLPIIDVSDRTLCGFETLIRWDHPTKGAIEPHNIIRIAEEINLITQIGDWAIRTACGQLKSWDTDLRVAVNVSPLQLKDGKLVSTVQGALASSGIQPSQLELNIARGVFLEEYSQNVSVFTQLRKSGVRLVFDDFGTGYSTLGYLRQVRFDKLKIDRSFVGGAGQDGHMNSAIISSIVTLAQALKLETTADGVQTPEELKFIQELGCSQAQGSVFGEPLTSQDATELLKSSGIRLSASTLTKYREDRRKILRRVRLCYRQYWFDVIIKNISRNGAMIEGLENIAEGSQFQIDFGNGWKVLATSIWSIGKQVGVRFEEPLEINNLDSALLPDFGCSEAKAS
ncbi:MAG: EAL domain-containing protein [Parasphingorhabdus sp.]